VTQTERRRPRQGAPGNNITIVRVPRSELAGWKVPRWACRKLDKPRPTVDPWTGAEPAGWTNEDLLLMWEQGRAYIPDGLAEAIDDARHGALPPPQLSYEERVRQRIAEMESHATRARDYHRSVAEELRRHDAQTLRLGYATPPIQTWAQIRNGCSETVWRRIWNDLSEQTRRSNTRLAPAGRP
jgi:hypothetical protein